MYEGLNDYSPEQTKARQLVALNEQNRASFDSWRHSAGAKDLPTIPPKVLKILIPSGIYTAAADPNHVDLVRVLEEPFIGLKPITNFLRFAVIEHTDNPVTNPGSFSFYNDYIIPTDRVLLSALMARFDDQLHVYQYQDLRTLRNSGNAIEFYKKLEDLARIIGCRYITGQNNSENVDFFLCKLGRVRLPTLPQELQAQFGAAVDSSNFHSPDFTVQMLD